MAKAAPVRPRAAPSRAHAQPDAHAHAGAHGEADATTSCALDPHEPRVPKLEAPALVIEQAAALFRALGDSARLSLLARLAQGEYCVTELAAATGEGLSTISQRLRTLRSERLLRRRRVGKHVYYTLADEHVALLIESALAHASE